MYNVKAGRVFFITILRRCRLHLKKCSAFATALLFLAFLAASAQSINRLPEQVFDDVPASHPFFNEIWTLYHAGITVGCNQSPLLFCPDRPTTRVEAAVFLERAAGIFNPPYTHDQTFLDVPPDWYQHGFVEDFARRRITNGCAPNLYCPTRALTREEAAIFIVRAVGFLVPPERAPVFSDVGPERLSYPYVNFLASRGITNGCEAGLFCPDAPITRGEMAAFIFMSV
jgi:hypothetical protein